MSTLEEIKTSKKNLDKAIESNNNESTLQILQNLSQAKITLEILKSTKLGKSVGKLRKHSNSEIQKLSEGLVNAWKKLLDAGASTKKEDDSKKRRNDEEQSSPSTAKKTKKEEEKPKAEPKVVKQASRPTGGNTQIRDKTREMLESALAPTDQVTDTLSAPQVAMDIEHELYTMFNGNTEKDYKAKFRSLHFNLKNPKNPALRNSVMKGELTADNTQDMASEETKRERKEIEEWQQKAAQVSQGNRTSTNMFKCGKCGKRETTYFQLQTRSSDEPMTTFHECTNCGNRWKS
ncbi:hypothetical protein PROFUN_12663 [Planoprotostelium fungivorum]|uniref:Transcription elongation factor n=1 Tax=Planoprotostelium fungivorum TaxID=1890364 RepID=A0A2P6N6Z7_9EUKA|nr:hypothetical protein PROFUN_12663 [Planoprotostelium fungivorum]